MKKIFLAICIIAFIGCTTNKTPAVESEKQVAVLPTPSYTYIVEYNGKIDTINARYYRAGNFAGYGKAIHFYADDMNRVATILIPENRELTIKTIK